jgi:hypothetical protein
MGEETTTKQAPWPLEMITPDQINIPRQRQRCRAHRTLTNINNLLGALPNLNITIVNDHIPNGGWILDNNTLYITAHRPDWLTILHKAINQITHTTVTNNPNVIPLPRQRRPHNTIATWAVIAALLGALLGLGFATDPNQDGHTTLNHYPDTDDIALAPTIPTTTLIATLAATQIHRRRRWRPENHTGVLDGGVSVLAAT